MQDVAPVSQHFCLLIAADYLVVAVPAAKLVPTRLLQVLLLLLLLLGQWRAVVAGSDSGQEDEDVTMEEASARNPLYDRHFCR